MISFGKYQKMPLVLVLPLLNSKQQGLFGESMSFEIDLEFIDTTGPTSRYVGEIGLYSECLLCKTTKPITLFTDRDGAGRLFLSGTKKIELPAGSHVYLIPESHQIYSLGQWTRFKVEQ
jgi:hypothetical protein